MIVKSLDDIDVEVAFCDAGYPPGATPNPILNTRAVWCKPANGKWMKSPHSSAMETSSVVRHTNAADLLATFLGKEITYEEVPEASSGARGETDATKLQSLQGHSPSDANKDSVGKPEE